MSEPGFEQDIAPAFDFTAASNAAEQAALGEELPVDRPNDEPRIPPDPEATELQEQAAETADDGPQQPPQPERPRDEQGRFLPNEPDGPFLGTYRTREDAERGMAEKDRYINELREQNRRFEEFMAQQQAEAQRPRTPANFDDLVEERPAYAAQLAYQAGDQMAFARAAEVWEEMAPGAPALYLQQMQMQQQMQQFAQTVQAQTQPLHEQREQQAWEGAVRQFTQQNPGFNEISDQEMISAAERNPIVGAILQNGDTPSRLQALNTLYLDALHARGAIQSAVQDVARTQAQEAERARDEAFTASSSTVTAQTPATPEESEEQRTIELWRSNRDRMNGWDVEHPDVLSSRLAKMRGNDDPDTLRRFGLGG